jgi:hypothetical protein
MPVKILHGVRRKRRVGRRPFRQGELCSTCGVYSVINAVRVVCPEVDTATAEYMFGLLMHKLLRTATNPSTAVTDGIGRLMLASLIKVAADYLFDDFEIQLKVGRLPKSLRLNANIDHLWVALEKQISPTCCAILGLGGKHSHWTVAVRISQLSIHLYDSGQLKFLPRARCTVRSTKTRHQIPPTHVILVERMENPRV